MTRYALQAILLVALLSSATLAGEFPYTARIATETAQLRSGPGAQFYATGQLLQDEEVEVYRHVGTWCAIRPTPSSFSYVRADHVRVTEIPDVLEISVEGARTRVGSEINDEFKVQYVTLHRGERVRMVGEPVTFGRPPRRWYKIAPPSGEFRWIARAELLPIESDGAERAAGAESSAEEEPSGNPEAAGASEPLTPIPADEIEVLDPELARTESSAEQTNDVQSAARSQTSRSAADTKQSPSAQLEPTPAEPLNSRVSADRTTAEDEASGPEADGPIPLQKLGTRAKGMATEPIPHEVITVSAEEVIEEHSSAVRRSDSHVSSDDSSIDNLPSIMVRRSTKVQPVATNGDEGHVAPAGGVVHDSSESVNSAWTAVDTELPPPPSPQQLDHSLGELAGLELELSRIVTQDIGTWNLEELQSRLVELRRSTGDAEARRAMEQLWKRAQEFAELQQRHRQLLAGGPAAIDASGAAPLSANAPVSPRDVALAGATVATPRRQPAMRNRPNAMNTTGSAAGAQPNAGAFAGQGWLVPVLTSRNDLPRFALTDAQGQILHFVTPAPGLNLRRYLRHQVGIVGSSRAGRTGEPGPLMAERVVVLDRR